MKPNACLNARVVEHGAGKLREPARWKRALRRVAQASCLRVQVASCRQFRVFNQAITRIAFTLVGWLALSVANAATSTEDFSTDPAANGWQIFGNTNLFQWDPTNQNLRVTWDSSQPNSYFHRPLGTILTRDDDFHLSFDLTFEAYAGGVRPGKPYAFPATIGFLNLDNATHTNFSRGAGINATYGPRNLVEFTFFPAFDVFLPTIAQVIVSTNNTWLYNHDNLLEMTPGETFRVTMNYATATHTLTTTVTNSAGQYGQTQDIIVSAPSFDFRVATLSISSYSDVRSQDSILAHGIVDNVTVVTPPPPVGQLSGGFLGANWQVQFLSRSNWVYVLERTIDLATWTEASTATPGDGATLILSDANPAAGPAFYRVRANRP
ncbi:MAG: hypothetical protein IH623_29030 [Verrucomicrobia bacterium]|nr:hypothetical protein [Verrucomicrobiota bacterium]